ncbi:MAG: cell division protein ZapA [Syntrophomonas sp.]|nr:cell division protein ZapA [Syntrophomonas sp.]
MVEKKSSNNTNRVTVEIFNQEYIVKGNENAEYIEMLAAYVDRRMRMIEQRNHSLSITKVAVLTALNLADELNKLQEDYDDLVKALEEEKRNRMV